MSDELKIYSLDYLKEQKYSDDTTEYATRLDCASLAVGFIDALEEQDLLRIDQDIYEKLKTGLFLATLGDNALRDAFLADKAIIIDGHEMYKPGPRVTGVQDQ